MTAGIPLDHIEAWAKFALKNGGPEDKFEVVLALVNVAKAAEQRPCNRFDITPCSQRPEIDEADWCAMCEALGVLDKDLSTHAHARKSHA